MKKTIEKNKLKNIEVIEGDSKEEVKKLIDKGIIADRVLMCYLPPPEEFIPFAVKILRKGGFIHYDALIGTERKEEDLEKVKKLFEEEAKKRNLVVEIVNAQRVKSYGPKLDHYVVDLQFI